MQNQRTLFNTEPNSNTLSLENRRYIGNKASLSDWIMCLINNEIKENVTTFADIFAGTASVTKASLKYFNKIITNDFLHSNDVIYKAFFENSLWDRKKLNEIIDTFNNLEAKILKDNYFSINFGGKFYHQNTAKKIGYIRDEIENIKNDLTNKEYNILLASLIYSIDKIANTVGHFDAYRKRKIPEPKFELKLIEPFNTNKVQIFKEDANQLVRKIKTDVAYIDPPYNSRQYSRFYHLYETLVKWDKPKLYGAALKPKPENVSEYCKTNAKNAFNDLIQNLDAKYIIVSYNNTFNPKSKSSKNKISYEQIESILNKRGETKVFENSYNYFNAGNTKFDNHKEFLFITKVNDERKKYYRSPLFYVGDKYKLIKEIKPFFPTNINRFIEPFTGGGSVFMNVDANEFLLNDINYFVYKIHKFLIEQAKDKHRFYENIKQKIYDYGFSRSYIEDIVPQELKEKHVKTYFAKFNKNAFQKLKADFNNEQDKDILKLYLLLIYGFNRMLRFNSKGKYNVPVGNVDFNQNVVNALNDYFKIVNQKNITFYNLDYIEFLNIAKPAKNDFVYFDPPYLVTFSEYNKLWNEYKEKELIEYLETLNKNNIKFAVSNVTHYKGKINDIFLDWAKKYNIKKVKSNYISYHDNSNKSIEEVLVMNYKPENDIKIN